jgi:hypothetical protein
MVVKISVPESFGIEQVAEKDNPVEFGVPLRKLAAE